MFLADEIAKDIDKENIEKEFRVNETCIENILISSDMEFVGVNAEGYQDQANLCIPNNATCYLVDISISKDGDIVYALVQ